MNELKVYLHKLEKHIISKEEELFEKVEMDLGYIKYKIQKLENNKDKLGTFCFEESIKFIELAIDDVKNKVSYR